MPTAASVTRSGFRRARAQRRGEQLQRLRQFGAVACRTERDPDAVRRARLHSEGVTTDHREAVAQHV